MSICLVFFLKYTFFSDSLWISHHALQFHSTPSPPQTPLTTADPPNRNFFKKSSQNKTDQVNKWAKIGTEDKTKQKQTTTTERPLPYSTFPAALTALYSCWWHWELWCVTQYTLLPIRFTSKCLLQRVTVLTQDLWFLLHHHPWILTRTLLG